MIHEPKFLAMAAVLGELGTEIESLGEVLCRDDGFASRHVRELQAIDLIAQKQRALAAILEGGFSDSEMRRITIESLHSRFAGFVDEDGPGCPNPHVNPQPGDLNLWD